MPLKSASIRFDTLNKLVNQFNDTPDNDHIQRIFYLQKIRYELNKTKLTPELFRWINEEHDNSWLKQLQQYNINPDCSFFLNGFQFVQAIMRYIEDQPETSTNKTIYDLMQQRDELLKSAHFTEETRQKYYEICSKMNYLATNDVVINRKIDKHLKVLALAQEKIIAIKKEVVESKLSSIIYTTKTLSEGGNNKNFKFKIKGGYTLDLLSNEERKEQTLYIDATDTCLNYEVINQEGMLQKGTIAWSELPDLPKKNEELITINSAHLLSILKQTSKAGHTPKNKFIFRLEYSDKLNLEQELQSKEVSKYFIEDFAVFRMNIADELGATEYKPVVLSQFANEGSLADIARNEKGKSPGVIASDARHYFTLLTDFCEKLIEAKAYHPDIKLTNFLVNNKLIRVSDRKTLITNEITKPKDISTSPLYAPPEFLECISRNLTFNAKAYLSKINMPQFMAYQLGIALKEFLILSQLDELPDEFRDTDTNAVSYFTNAPKQIINLSLLVQELTRTEPERRLTVKQFQSLLNYLNQSPDNFYQELEKILPSSKIGLQNEIDEINKLINSNLKGEALLKQANLIFQQVSDSDPKETRITRMAEKLATKCFREHSIAYFKQCSDAIEKEFLNADWVRAPWYRKALHWLTLGYFRVERVSDLDSSKIKIPQDLKGEEFQSHFIQLEFLPSTEITSLGAIESMHFTDFIFTHIEEIINQEDEKESTSYDDNRSNDELSESGSLDTGTVVILKKITSEAISLANSLDSGTVVFRGVKKDKSESLADDKELDSGTFIDKEESDSLADDESKNSGTFVVTEHKTPLNTQEQASGTVITNKNAHEQSPAGAAKKEMNTPLVKHWLFADIEKLEKPHGKKGHLIRAQTARSTLFRGDGSHRARVSKQRPKASDINFEAPITPHK